LFLLLNAAYTPAQSDYTLTDAASIPASGNIAVSSTTGKGGEIVLLSPAQCEEIRRFSIDTPVYALADATAKPGSLWAAADSSLMLISTDNGSVDYSASPLAGGSIKGIAQSADGTYVLVWGANRAALLKYTDSAISVEWAEQLDFEINAAAIDQKSGNFYLAGADLAILSLRGGQLHRYSLNAPTLSMAVDSARALLYMANEAGIVRYNNKSGVFTRLTAIPAKTIGYTEGSDRISILNDNNFSTFSYPDFGLLSVKPASGEGMELADRSGAFIYSKDKVDIYGVKSGNRVGSLFVSGNGSGFTSPLGAYYGNKSFADAYGARGVFSEAACRDIKVAAGSKTVNPPKAVQVATAPAVKPTAPKPAPTPTPTPAPTQATTPTPVVTTTAPAVKDNQTVNTTPAGVGVTSPDNQTPPVTAGVTSPDDSEYIPPVYRPDNLTDNGSAAVPPGRNPGMMGTEIPVIPAAPTPQGPTGQGVEIPIIMTPSVPTPAAPTVAAPAAPSVPAASAVQNPTQASGVQIPSWVMNPTSLPSFSTVATGEDDAAALNAGKLKIRDDVARSVMKSMLEDELVIAMDDEVRKRMLWMVAGRTGQTAADYTMQTGKWISPNRSHYVLAQISEDAVNQIFEPIFKEEADILATQGNAAYMAREVYQWP
jgi:hypothetical protein